MRLKLVKGLVGAIRPAVETSSLPRSHLGGIRAVDGQPLEGCHAGFYQEALRHQGGVGESAMGMIGVTCLARRQGRAADQLQPCRRE